MRLKIIGIYSAIVILVGVMAFFLARGALSSASSNQTQVLAEAKRSAQSAASRLQLDGLRTERWLTAKANDAEVADVMGKGSPAARADAATQASEKILASAKTSSALGGNFPAFVLIVDSQGLVVGRNGTNAGRNDNLVSLYPGLKETLTQGQANSEIWAEKSHNDQFLASYVPLRENGKIIGALAAGFTLNDELSRVSEAMGGRSLKLAKTSGGELVASSAAVDGTAGAIAANAKSAAEGTLSGGVFAQAFDSNVVSGALVEGLADGKKYAVLSALPSSSLDPNLVMWPIFGATAVGLLLVVLLGWLIGNYIEGPIETLEEGLLAIINGQTDRRFRLDHPDLGGVAFRLDQLLNQLMGVEEDNTDEEGRVQPSMRPGAVAGAGVGVEGSGDDDSSRLAAEPEAAYYSRLYAEYISTKKGLGEPTDHITEQAFAGKIRQMEADALQRTGKPVRYKVALNGREVQLLAVSLK